MGSHEAGYEGTHIAGETGKDLAICCDRPGRVTGALLIVGHFGFPNHVPRFRCQRHQVSIRCAQKDFILIDGDIPGDDVADVFRQLSTVLPDQFPCSGIEGLHHVAGMGKVHHSLVDDGFLLLRPILHRPRPGQAQLGNILAIHLLQRAVSAGAVIATPSQPISWIGILKDGVGDRNEV